MIQFELVEADGRVRVTSDSALFLAKHAVRLWPDRAQDEPGGWSIRQVGADDVRRGISPNETR